MNLNFKRIFTTWQQTFYSSLVNEKLLIQYKIKYLSNMSLIKSMINLLYRAPQSSTQVQQVRHRFVDWRMLKDYNKRLLHKKYGKEKLRLNGLRKNKILPKELQVIADEEVAAIPRQSSITQLRERCVITSRPRGIVRQFRVSRIVFRHLVDYNKLSGVQRAMW